MARVTFPAQPQQSAGTAESLALRLAIGYQRIEEARAAGLDTTALEEFWLKLLHEYEAAYSAVAVAA